MDFQSLDEAMMATSYLTLKFMDEILPNNFSESRLVEAMRYSSLSDGKRIRPFLLIMSANIFGANIQKCVYAACAIEFVHVYSLIHDDLPAMDNDDFRRGKLSNHKKFNEATAILAGDALLTLAFEILSNEKTHHNPQIRCELVSILAKAAGYRGMVGGQMIDIENIDRKISSDKIIQMHRLKTAELFMASAECGAILGGATHEEAKALRYFANDLGLAFQIKDDIFDHSGSASGSKKIVEIDEIVHKKPQENASIVDLIGLEAAQQKLTILQEQSKGHLKIFGSRAKFLLELVDFVILRKS